MTDTSIQWTDKTWNPVRGCSIVSPGCVNCYAMKQAHRFSGEGKAYHGLTKLTERSGPQWTGKVVCDGSKLNEPLKWRTPARVFVNSMSDLFHEEVDPLFVGRVFNVMAQARRHTFQILTKRAERMREIVSALAPFHTAADGSGWPLPNVWLGVSAEDQQRADERIPLLLQTPAAVRFVSAEPLLGPIDFGNLRGNTFDALTGCGDRERLGDWEDTPRLDWVIVGGESGNGARPMDLAWARSIVEQCKAAGVACFVKQLGSLPAMEYAEWQLLADIGPAPLLSVKSARRQHTDNGRLVVLAQPDRKGGEPEAWPVDLRVREWPEVRQ